MVNASITADGTGVAAGKVCIEEEKRDSRKKKQRNNPKGKTVFPLKGVIS